MRTQLAAHPPRPTLMLIAALALTIMAPVGPIASVAQGQATPVRSSLEADTRIGLSVVDLTDIETSLADQGATTDPLGPLTAPAAIGSSDGVFTASSTADATFTGASSGTFNATQTYDGDQIGDEPTAQSFAHTLMSIFEYDFTLTSDGSVRFQGELVNSGPSFIGFTVQISVFNEFMPGSGFTSPFFQQTLTDQTSAGATPFDLTVPLTAASGSYRIQIRLSHSGNSILEIDPEAGSTTFDWTITAPSACPADTNGDGLVTPADFNAWILAFNTQSPACDQNGDGLCTPADFNAWILNFNAGC